MTIPTPNPLYEQGKKCLEQGLFEDALAAFDQLAQSTDARVHYQRGLTLYELGRVKEAAGAHRTALKYAPGHPDILTALGGCYFAEGNREKAGHYFEKALEKKPDNIFALANLVHIHRYDADAPAIRQLLKLHAAAALQGRPRAHVCFALAEAYEKMGSMQEAFAYYEEANRAAFATCRYDVKNDIALMQRIAEVFSPEYFAALPEDRGDDATPIFIVGMPRSGTTLIEQILTSHSQVKGAGEANAMAVLAFKTLKDLTGQDFPQAAASLKPAHYGALREGFLAQIRKRAGDAPHIVTKLPTDFLMVGLIHTLFPEAAIIHTKRDAMDTCWSLYKHFFETHPYCYDQASLGAFYKSYDTLMAHWHRTLPGRIHDVAYENLLEAPEETIRALLAHAKLPWEKSCLNFHKTERQVTTASALQVRRPLYKTSLKSWEAVADRLQVLRDALA